MPLDFYYLLKSPPCRAVLLTAKAVGVELNLKEVDIFSGEHLKPEFVALNPQHTLPTLVDGDFVLWESRAICVYLASKYGEDDSLFPNEPRARAKVEHLNNFDMGTLFHRFGNYVRPLILKVEKTLDPEKLEKVHEALGWLNGWMSHHKFAASDNITVADHTLLATVSSIKAANVSLDNYPNIVAWLGRCRTEMPGYDLNQKGADEFGAMIKSRLSS